MLISESLRAAWSAEQVLVPGQAPNLKREKPISKNKKRKGNIFLINNSYVDVMILEENFTVFKTIFPDYF